MSHSRDLERLTRSMLKQKLEYEYVRHYLMEAYQLDEQTLARIFERIGYQPPVKGRGGKEVKQSGGPTRQNFY